MIDQIDRVTEAAPTKSKGGVAALVAILILAVGIPLFVFGCAPRQTQIQSFQIESKDYILVMGTTTMKVTLAFDPLETKQWQCFRNECHEIRY